MDDSKVKRLVCTRILEADGITQKTVHLRVVNLGDYDDAQSRIRDLEAALFYSAFAQHGTKQYELPPGIRLIDGNRVEVKVRGRWVSSKSADTPLLVAAKAGVSP